MKPLIHYKKKIKNNYFVFALASLVWLIFKTGTKPSRIQYPCQKAAAANLVLFTYMISITPFHKIIKPIKNYLKNYSINKKELMKYSVLFFCFLFVFYLISFGVNKYQVSKSWDRYEESLSNYDINFLENMSSKAYIDFPYPNRVVSIHDSSSTTWAGSGHPYDYMDQTEINEMVERGVMELTGESTPQDAWASLVRYSSNESVAIKVNFNNAGDCSGGFTSDAYMNPYPKLVNSVIDGLKSVGIPSDKIWITDPSRPITDSFRAEITDSGVQYYTKCSAGDIGGRANVFTTGYVIDGSNYSTLVDLGDGTDWVNPADVFVNADHIINIPQLKGHGGASITLGLKNNFGSVDFTEFASGYSSLHDYFYISGSKYSTERNLLVDINENPIFANKTRLILGDGLMGNPTINYQNPVLWDSFGNSPPEILFFGVDPIAVDSVMFDYLQRECNVNGYSARNDDILYYAASQGLGIFEHWDSDSTRQYSSIDYVEIDLDLVSQTCSDLGGVDCCTGLNYCSGTIYSGASDCSGVCCSITCTTPVCNNNNQEPGEVCDGTDLGGETCISLGFSGGDLGCLSDCLGYDTSECIPSSSNLCDNLVSLYHFDGDGTDSSGNSNNATINGASYTTSGKFNGAYVFDGGNDYAVTNTIDFSGTDKLTVSFWVYPNAAIGGSNLMLVELSPNTNGRTDSFWINIDTPGGESHSGSKGNVGYNTWEMSTPLVVGSWNHVVYTYDKSLSSSEVKGYFNGVLDGATNPSFDYDNTNNFANQPFYIASRAGTTEFFNGRIDDIAIWDRVLSASEIQQIYNSGTAISCTTSACTSGADGDEDSIVSISELINFITEWKNGNVSISDLLNGITEWKNGCA